ncbi:MAG: bifunctional folylpolyglutamate synthase/dihydrofolate synthase [Thermodesulfovibrionales bacterium]|nr:bifunctional folylpolyglutamate synthase/dihydrofolate synthase [Thermodesulfovibrionales bacterium]
MTINYNETINYLYSLQKYGIKLGLEKISLILTSLGSPHRNFKTIHIAGTNGKGSVSAMIASILRAYGYRVGLFTSPHLVSFTERISINGIQITEDEVVKLTQEIKSLIDSLNVETPTFFEFVTAMAFLYFSRMGIDWGVIEVGMGGRLDCTNVIYPEVSVITRISYDHKEFLGDTLTAIASEKAGIIKEKIPVITSEQEVEAQRVLVNTAKSKSSPLYCYGKDFKGILKKSDFKGLVFDFLDFTNNETLHELFTPLAGEHQLINSSVAIKAATLALRKKNLQNDYYIIKKGLSETRWRGRLEIFSQDPLILIDGAHNPDAAEKLAMFLKKYLDQYNIILLIGIMSDKDIQGILSPLMPLCEEIIFTAPNYGRAASAEVLSDLALKAGYISKTSATIQEALKKALEIYDSLKKVSTNKKSPLILITGSFYTIGEAMEVLGEKAIFGNLREKV